MKEHDDILKKLESLKENSPLKVPEGYFDALPGRVQSRIQNESSFTQKTIIQLVKPWMGLAASFLIIAAIYFSFGPFKMSHDSSNMLADNFGADIDPIAFQFSEYELTNYIAEQDIDVSLDESLSQIDLSDLSEEDVKELILF